MIGAAVRIFFGLALEVTSPVTAMGGDLVLDEETSDSSTKIMGFDFDLKKSANPVLAPGISELLTYASCKHKYH